jgi:sulfotransferase family protein
MLANTARELSKVAVFLGVDPDPERIATAVRRSDAGAMRKLEEAQAKLWSTTRETRQDIPFVRAAKAGGWKAGLPEAAVAPLEAAWGHLMVGLGYELLFPEKAAAFDSRSAEIVMNGSSQ